MRLRTLRPQCIMGGKASTACRLLGELGDFAHAPGEGTEDLAIFLRGRTWGGDGLFHKQWFGWRAFWIMLRKPSRMAGSV